MMWNSLQFSRLVVQFDSCPDFRVFSRKCAFSLFLPWISLETNHQQKNKNPENTNGPLRPSLRPRRLPFLSNDALGGGGVVGATDFLLTANLSAGQCTESGAVVACTFDFGPGGPFALDVGAAPVSRRFIQGFNVVSAPEPGTLSLLGAGLLSLAIAKQRRA